MFAHPGVRALLVVLLGLVATGCSRWRFASSPAPTVVATERPERVRVTRGDGSRLEISDPSVRNDSIVGTARRPACTLDEAMDPARDCPMRSVPVGIASSDMVELELRERSVMRSMVLAGGLALGIYRLVRMAAPAFGS